MDIISSLGLAFSTLLVLLLPGYFLYYIFLKNLKVDFFQSLIISVGLSLSFMPLLVYSFTLMGIKLNKILIVFLFLFFFIIIIFKYIIRHGKNSEYLININDFNKFLNKFDTSSYIILAAILLISLAVRLMPLKDMIVGPGVDSYHHTLIVQLIVENGGIPKSYEPYSQLSPFTYHFGFHSVVAILYWISNISIVELVPYTGQILNSFALLSVFIFVDRIFNDRRMALVSSFIVGLISVFPAYLVNAGRSTSLTGIVLLPIALVLVFESFKLEKRENAILILSGLVLSGLFLAHYRIIIAALTFIAVYILYELYSNMNDKKREGEIILRCIILGITMIILLLPWLIHLINNNIVLSEINSTANYYRVERIGDISYFSNIPLLILSLCGAMIGIIKKNKYIIIISFWSSILIVFSNPYWMKLPGSGRLDILTVVTFLFFPAAVFSSYFIIYLSKKIGMNNPKAIIIIVFIIIIILTPFSAYKMSRIFNHGNVFVKEGDNEAMKWIKVNTSVDDVFFINTFTFDWNKDFTVGIDGGLWIPLLTKRHVTIPPMTYLIENPNNFAEKVKTMSKAAESITTEPTIQYLAKNNVTYVYFGGNDCCNLKLKNLQNNPYLLPVYNKDGVLIFKISYDMY